MSISGVDCVPPGTNCASLRTFSKIMLTSLTTDRAQMIPGLMIISLTKATEHCDIVCYFSDRPLVL